MEDVSAEKVSVEQAFNICLIFYNTLWPFVEPTVTAMGDATDDIRTMHELFLLEACTGFECSSEWIEAVFRTTKIPKKEQRQGLMLTIEEVFLCTVEFCKFYEELFKWNLWYIRSILQSMQDHPINHSLEWSIWKKAVARSFTMSPTYFDLNWNAELPRWSD